jgi:hypothetical protein
MWRNKLESSKAIIQRAMLEHPPYAIVAMVSGGADSLTALNVARYLEVKIDAILMSNKITCSKGTHCVHPEGPELPPDQFYKNKKRGSLLFSWCKECEKLRQRDKRVQKLKERTPRERSSKEQKYEPERSPVWDVLPKHPDGRLKCYWRWTLEETMRVENARKDNT